MRAYTIVVQPDAQDDGHTATVPDLPGWATSGRTVEECVERAREVIGLFVDDLDPSSPAHTELSGRAAGEASDEAGEEAVDALRRAMAALRTVESHLEEEIIRTPEGRARRPLRHAHGALIRARLSLVEEERRAVERVPDHVPV
jgi:predicted RNase H-like HicB family nuclease